MFFFVALLFYQTFLILLILKKNTSSVILGGWTLVPYLILPVLTLILGCISYGIDCTYLSLFDSPWYLRPSWSVASVCRHSGRAPGSPPPFWHMPRYRDPADSTVLLTQLHWLGPWTWWQCRYHQLQTDILNSVVTTNYRQTDRHTRLNQTIRKHCSCLSYGYFFL